MIITADFSLPTGPPMKIHINSAHIAAIVELDKGAIRIMLAVPIRDSAITYTIMDPVQAKGILTRFLREL